MNVRPLLVCALLVLGACAPKNIPGTQIPDTEDTRAILNVMERYRTALEARDATAIQGMVSKNFRDNAGTEDPADDLTAANLGEALPRLFARMDEPRVMIDVRTVTVKEDGVATVIYHYNSSWRAPGLLDRAHRDSELEEMILEKQDGKWLIVSGM